MDIKKRMAKEKAKKVISKYKKPDVSLPKADTAGTKAATVMDKVESLEEGKVSPMKFETPKPRMVNGIMYYPDTTGKTRKANAIDKKAMRKEADTETSRRVLEGDRLKREKKLRDMIKGINLK